jgi:hypothetical protein
LSLELLEMVNAHQLLVPRLAYEQHPASHPEHGWLQLGVTRLQGRRLASVLASATAGFVAVCTIGSRLEEHVQRYFDARERTKALLLDGIGSAAADAVARESCHLLHELAASRGESASSALSPGTSGFPLSEQKKVFQLVDAGRIGVHLTPTIMMAPRKSISMVVGIGPEMPTWTQEEICANCGMRETCRYRTCLSASGGQ